MQISIIVPIYQVEQYIERCINSIVKQAFTDYEVILVDDASPDNTLLIAENLLQENQITFQVVKHQENQSLSEARNSGLKVAKGKYIIFMDSDDELSYNEVLTQFYETIEREKADFVAANHQIIYGETDIRKEEVVIKEAVALYEKDILYRFLLAEFSMSSWNKIINRNFLLNNQLFFVKGLRSQDELHTFQMCLAAKKCYCLPDYCYNYYKENRCSITNNQNEKTYNDNVFILKKQLEIASEKQLINKNNADAFVYHYKRMSQKILFPRVLKNKVLWMKYYNQISNIYQHSELWQYKKRFWQPAQIAYFVRCELRKNHTFFGSRLYKKVLRKARQYNG